MVCRGNRMPSIGSAGRISHFDSGEVQSRRRDDIVLLVWLYKPFASPLRMWQNIVAQNGKPFWQRTAHTQNSGIDCAKLSYNLDKCADFRAKPVAISGHLPSGTLHTCNFIWYILYCLCTIQFPKYKRQRRKTPCLAV